MERENIRVQTMAGREQKAREGKWNGGFAPYGYRLENGELVIAEDGVEIIQMIFDRYIHTNDGMKKIQTGSSEFISGRESKGMEYTLRTKISQKHLGNIYKFFEKGIDIGIYMKDFENEYISLTDIAKYRNDNDPRFVI